jgi:hypothetical protein
VAVIGAAEWAGLLSHYLYMSKLSIITNGGCFRVCTTLSTFILKVINMKNRQPHIPLADVDRSRLYFTHDVPIEVQYYRLPGTRPYLPAIANQRMLRFPHREVLVVVIAFVFVAWLDRRLSKLTNIAFSLVRILL